MNVIEQFPTDICVICGRKTKAYFNKYFNEYFLCETDWHIYRVEKSIVYPKHSRVELQFYHKTKYYFDIVSTFTKLWMAESGGYDYKIVQDFAADLLSPEWFAAKNIEEIINKINTLINFS